MTSSKTSKAKMFGAVFFALSLSAICCSLVFSEGLQQTVSHAMDAIRGQTSGSAAIVATPVPGQTASAYFKANVVPLFQERNPEKLEAALKNCLALDPHFVPALYRMGLLAESKESWGDALDYFQKGASNTRNPAQLAILKIEADKAQFYKHLDSLPNGKKTRQYDDRLMDAQFFLKQHLYSEAAREANAAIAIDGTRWEAYIELAAAKKGAGHNDQAADAFAKALAAAPGASKQKIQALLDKAVAEQQLTAREKQCMDLLNAAKTDSDHADAGKKAYEAYKLFPDKAVIALVAAKYYTEGGDYDQALEVLNTALRSVPESDAAQSKSVQSQIDAVTSLKNRQVASDSGASAPTGDSSPAAQTTPSYNPFASSQPQEAPQTPKSQESAYNPFR